VEEESGQHTSVGTVRSGLAEAHKTQDVEEEAVVVHRQVDKEGPMEVHQSKMLLVERVLVYPTLHPLMVERVVVAREEVAAMVDTMEAQVVVVDSAVCVVSLFI
jgi:hypothetical protein